MGIGGDEVEGVYKRMNLAFDRKPNQIILEIGINDIINSVPEDTIKHYFRGILKEANKRKQKMIVCSIGPSSTEMSSEIICLNKWLSQETVDNGLTYLDIFTPLQKDSILSPIYDSGDHVHMNGKGYMLWATLLKEKLW